MDPVVRETWIWAEFYRGYRYLEWSGLVKTQKVNKNQVQRKLRLVGEDDLSVKNLKRH